MPVDGQPVPIPEQVPPPPPETPPQEMQPGQELGGETAPTTQPLRRNPQRKFATPPPPGMDADAAAAEAAANAGPPDATAMATPTPATPHPFVALEVSRDGQSVGRLVVELFPDVAPQTVANFLQYVDSGFYNNTVFHRILSDYILQGGGYAALDQPKKDGLRPPIPNEAKPTQRHLRGTIAAARLHRDLNSATSQFFFNLSDNRRLDRHSYAVFGKLVEGMEVVDRVVEQTPVETSPLEPAFQTRPTNPPVVTRAFQLPADYKPPVQQSPTEKVSPATSSLDASASPPPATPAMPVKPSAIAPANSPAPVPAPAPSPGAAGQPVRPTERPRLNRRNRPESTAAPGPEQNAAPDATQPGEMTGPPDVPARDRNRLRPGPRSPAQPAEKPKTELPKAPKHGADPSF